MKNLKSKKGLSLAEIVMAIALVALCIGGIIGVAVQSLYFEQSVDYSHSAINIARDRIERLRQIRQQQGYAAIPQNAETDELVDANGVSDLSGNFKRTTIIDTITYPGVTCVTVRVTYKRKGIFTTQPIELVTFISPNM